MTAANPSSPPDVNKDLHHDDLVQRLKSMSTVSPTPPQGPNKTPTPTKAPIQDTPRSSSSSSSSQALCRHHGRKQHPRPPAWQHLRRQHDFAQALYTTLADGPPARHSHLPHHSATESLALLSLSSSLPERVSVAERAAHDTGPFVAYCSRLPRWSLPSPASPLRSPKRTRSPRALEPRPHTVGAPERYGSGIRPASIGSFEGAPSVCDISEDAELELTPRVGTTVSSLYSSTGSLSRRRRPASPLYQVSVSFGAPPTSTPSVSTPTSTASSPLLAPSRFNENYPMSHASSSVPSTPTSMRSRSPSISSLETIEDSPDAEEEAIEADRIRRLKAAADREDGGEARRSSLDVPEGRGRSLGFGKRDSRKRWSVCGAERRGDLDLETIWED
ncbi:unnamed protein product [Alternaria alternata]